ncbi:putative zinc metalloprotease EGY2 [Abeliophyllum distichum]|uniref:Zinc metalloprotease EGY2 n=1 Tax=Abeliophyllum distichum TaxID=126358 RepID=A0ABD1UNA6_9LAMI
MYVSASFGGNSIPLSQCSSYTRMRFQPLLYSPTIECWSHTKFISYQFSRTVFRGNVKVICRVSETETEPESNNDEDNDESAELGILQSESPVNDNGAETNDVQPKIEDVNDVQVASGSPLPGVKPQQLDESIRIPKETIEILRDQVFGFDTFFVTSQEPYEAGVLFKGNLRGQAARSYEKITKRMEGIFGDQYKLFLLINPEDDKPVAVVVPRKTLQPETTAVPEWFAAGAFGLVTIFTLLLRNVPALQANILSIFYNIDLLENGLPGALVTALVLAVHEISHALVAKEIGIKLGVPYFVPSWQIGSFGAITRIVNIVPKREDLLKVAAAGPLAGFSLGIVLLLLGFILPPADGLGVIVDASVFHESFLAGGIAKLLLGDALKEGTPVSVNPLVIWAWAGLLINAINSIPAGELDGGRISFSLWGRKASARLTGACIVLLGLASLFNDVAFYWVVLIFFLQRGPIAPLSEEITDPDNKYIALGVVVLLLGLLVCLPYPFPFTADAVTSF